MDCLWWQNVHSADNLLVVLVRRCYLAAAVVVKLLLGYHQQDKQNLGKSQKSKQILGGGLRNQECQAVVQ